MSTRVDAPSPPASPNVPVQRARAMHSRPFKKRDWDAELAALGVPSDSPMRRIQRHLQDNSEDKENFIGVDDVSAREGTTMEATVGSVRDDGTSTPDQAKTKGVARRGWSPAIPFDLGADRSPFLTDVAESPVGDDASPVPELARWKPGATPRAIGGMLGGVYGRDDEPSLDASVPGDATRGRESAPNGCPPESQPVAFLGSNTDPLAMAWLAKLTRAGFHVATCVGTHVGSNDDGMSTGDCVPGRGCQPASHARHATELVLGSQSNASPKVWAPGLRAKSARDTCVRGEGPPAPRPLLLARFTHESSFSHAMDKVLCGGDEADRRLMGGRLIVLNATPMSPFAAQRIGDKLASIGVAYVQIALAGSARECELGDTHAFVAYTDGKVAAHIGKQCGTIAGFGVKNGVIHECVSALGVIAQEPPTIVSHTEASACAKLRLVETVRTVAMRARVSNEFRIGAKLARSESERSKLLAKVDEMARDANEAKRDSKLAREDAATSSKALVDAERHNADLNRRLREATTEIELERRAAADADAERINLTRELRAVEDAVARSIPASDECDLNSTKDENHALRESVEELRGTVQAERASTAAKIAAVVQAKAELEKQLVSVQSNADAAERSEREAVSAAKTLRADVNRLDADLTSTRTDLEATTRTVIDERRRANAATQSLEAFKIQSESDVSALQAALSAQSTRFQTVSGELARARAEIELLVDETHVLRDELAVVNGKSEAAVAKAAEETEAANAKTAEAESRLEAKEKELWCLQRQLERRGREANIAAKAASERIASLTDEKASFLAESTGAKAAIRRCNKVKEEAVRKLRDELDETKKALLHATSRRVGRPWAEDNAVNASSRTQKTENSTAEELETKKKLEERLEKERSRREKAEASVASLQSALTTARKQSHAETEKAVNELIEARDAVARAEAERTSIQAQLRGRVEVAAEYATRARADAGTKARLKAQYERANRELTREKEALGRIAKRLGEMQGAQGEASSIRQLAEDEAESLKAKYTELALKVSGAQKATADATLLASTATAELEIAVRAKDAAVEDAARLRSRVDTYEQTVSELREEIRGFSTSDVAAELKTAMAKQSEAHESALCELRNKAAAAEAQARKATAALVKTEAWARAAEKALATEKANSPIRASVVRASTQSVGMSAERFAVVGSRPASPASIVPLRTRDLNVVNGDEDAGAGRSPKNKKPKAASVENNDDVEVTPASSVENIPALLESHAPSPARPLISTSLTPNSRNPDTGSPHEVKQRIADRLGDVAFELEELSPSKASLETALGSLDMKPTLDALRLGKRIPRGCTALAAILAVAVTDPDAVDLTLTKDSVIETLKCGETFGDESLCSYEVNAVYTQWLAIRAYLNHHAVTVGDHAVGALARRTRVEPMESRMRAAGSQNSFGSDRDLSFAVSTLKALIDGGLGEDDARSSGCVVCELLHAWSVTAVRSWQLCAAQERLDTELLEAEFGRIPAETSGTEEDGEKEEKDEVERAFAKVVAVKKVRTMQVKKAAAKPPRQPSRVRDFVF